ncbi:unnamed protein product [Agarophyton chilense]
MVTTGDQAIISFFTEQQERERRRNSDHGEVPEIFKTNEFQVSISGFTLALPNPWRCIKLHAELSIQAPGTTEFVHRLTTETIEGQCSPIFTRRATFAPFQMRNSQHEAKQTLVKVDIYLCGELIFSTKFELARLLWDGQVEKKVEPVIPIMLVVKNRKAVQGRIAMDVVRRRPIGTPPDNHEIVLNFEFGAKIWATISEQSVYFTLCGVGFRGRWNRVFASKNIKKQPFKRKIATIFPRVYLSRGDLINDNPSNPVRVELYGYRRGYPKLLGYCHVTLAELNKPRIIAWNNGPSSTMSAIMRITSSPVSQTQSELNLHLISKSAPETGIHPSSEDENFSQLSLTQETFCALGESPISIRNAKFDIPSRKTELQARKEKTAVSPKHFSVHFPATHRSALDDAAKESADDYVYPRENKRRFGKRLKTPY